MEISNSQTPNSLQQTGLSESEDKPIFKSKKLLKTNSPSANEWLWIRAEYDVTPVVYSYRALRLCPCVWSVLLT